MAARSIAFIDRDFYRLARRASHLDMLESFAAARPGRAERSAAGKALRQGTPRSAHAHYRPARDRADPVAVLMAQNATRI